MDNYYFKFIKGVYDKKELDELYLIYKDNIQDYQISLQTKPILNEDKFNALLKRNDLIVGEIFYKGLLSGFTIFIFDLDIYPESHYSKEYFNTYDFTSSFLNGDKTLLFAVGDRCGIVLSRGFRNILSKDALSYKKCIYEYYRNLKIYIGKKVVLIVNYSQHAENQLKLREPNIDIIKSINENFKTVQLDYETFVHIHWMENVLKKSRLLWTLKNVGRFVINNNIDTNDNILYITKKLFGYQYKIRKYSVVPMDLE